MKARIAFMALATGLVVSSLFASSPRSRLLLPFVSAGEGPQFIIDYSSFKGNSDRTYVEFYVQVPYDGLQFVKSGQGFRAEYELILRVLDKNGRVVESQIMQDAIELDSFWQTVANDKARICLFGFTFSQGEHTVSASLEDRETHDISLLKETFQVRDFCRPKLSVSDLQFSSKITQGEDGEAYVKNQRCIQPNPAKTFALDPSEHMFIYFEIYNLSHIPEAQSHTYTATYTFIDSEGKVLAKLRRDTDKPGDSAAHSLRFPLHHFPTGAYSMQVKIRDDQTSETALVEGEFTVIGKPMIFSQNDLPD